MHFLSIDSSLAHTGIALGRIINNKIHIDAIHLCETTKTKNKQIRASSDTIDRCRQTINFLREHIKTHQPKIIFIETPTGSQSAAGMKSYGATCQLIAAINPAPIQVTAMETKLATGGTKTASKRDIINWAFKLYPQLSWKYYKGQLQDKNEHMADAIAIAYAGIKLPEFQRLSTILNNEL